MSCGIPVSCEGEREKGKGKEGEGRREGGREGEEVFY